MADQFSTIFKAPIGEPVQTSDGVITPSTQNFLLREDGFRFLREDNGFIVREGS